MEPCVRWAQGPGWTRAWEVMAGKCRIRMEKGPKGQPGLPHRGGLRWEHRGALGGAAVGMERPGDLAGKGFQGEGVNAA